MQLPYDKRVFLLKVLPQKNDQNQNGIFDLVVVVVVFFGMFEKVKES